jgi:hypothetical protein
MATKNSKVISSGPMKPVRGGPGHMTGNKVGTQTPGQTATKPTNTGGKFAKGGNGHMVGRTGSKPAVPGKVNVNGGKSLGGTGSGGGKRGTGSFSPSGF